MSRRRNRDQTDAAESGPIRCAIYTRKSSEEGLDQEFNSLDAQRESAEAFIASQKAEGWVVVPDRYDDGGFSGGSIERPALERLLRDIDAGKIDCVVVYKVDRLSRSLMDFSRILETFERSGVSFVSVTQQLTYACSGSHFIQLKDGKRAGPVENQLTRLALSAVQRADSHLSRKAREVESRRREIERQKRDREEAERRRIEEERRQAELVCRDRLLGMAEDWRTVSSLGSFLKEVERRLGREDGTDYDRDLLARWLRWGASVVRDRHPFSRPLGELPEVTHPGIREAEHRAMDAQASAK